MTYRSFAVLIALSVAGMTATLVSTPVQARTQVSIGIGIAPPPLRFERVPGPRAGFIWTPGYWNWNGYSYIWITGGWLPRRAGYDYVRPSYSHVGGRWSFHQAQWRSHRGYVAPRGHAHSPRPVRGHSRSRGHRGPNGH